MNGSIRCASILLISSLSSLLLAADDPSTADSAGLRLFESKIRPLFVQHCHECHGPDGGKGEADLRLDSLEALLRGGKSGPALIPGEPGQSLIMLAVKHDGAVAMPPRKKLAQSEIDALSAWIKLGAPWPGTVTVKPPTASTEKPREWSDEARQFWAFQPLRRVEPPKVRRADWPRNEIDRFILARLEDAKLEPAAQADKLTWLRRTTLDLWGLPPTPPEMEAFLHDNSAEAHAHVLDRLLASPFYGERWARHWLDLVRYADSNGMDDNLSYSDAWRYRNYVIAALNADLPFTQFVQEQLAGDLLARSAPPARHDELVTATGFLAIGPKMLAEDDPVKQQLDIVDEQLDTTCRVFMSLTMGCVRCHDHKFDPLTMSDYYGLAGIFQSTRTMISYRVDSKWITTGLGGRETDFRLKDLEQIIDRHDNALVNGNTTAMSADERAAHDKLLKQALKDYEALPKAMSVSEGQVTDLEIRLRGNHLTRGSVVPRRFPSILSRGEPSGITKTDSGRLQFARWLTRDDHPLTSRVIVNRIWRWHFGAGLVASVDNFGKLGETPSHPELLDWLATTFVSDGWSLKKLHRRILLSRTWQMSSQGNAQASQIDPRNRLLWHMPRQRMEAEVLRDSLLAVSGQLDTTRGEAPLTAAPFHNLSQGGQSRSPELFQSARRSIYLPVLRGAVYDVFQAFDVPDPAVLNGDRMTTTVAAQALFMMNGTLVQQASRRLGELLLGETSSTDRARLQVLCQRLFGRRANDEELSTWETFLTEYQQIDSIKRETPEIQRGLAWEGLCRALLSSNEFLYIE